MINYGLKNDTQKSFTIQEMYYLIFAINGLIYMHKIAYTLVSIDYREILTDSFAYAKSKEETWNDNLIMQVVEISYSYGFQLKDIVKKGDMWNLQVEVKRQTAKNHLVKYCSVIASIFEEYKIDLMEFNKNICKITYNNGKIVLDYKT